MYENSIKNYVLTSVAVLCFFGSRVDKWDHDVSGAVGDSEAFVVVSEAARVH